MEEDDKRKTSPFHPPPTAKTSHATAPPAMAPDEEEKMEKFYELISNLKALSGIWKGTEASRKRMKSHESLLWKPTFELEDFAGGSDGFCSTTRYEEDGRKKRRKELEGESESIFDLKLGL